MLRYFFGGESSTAKRSLRVLDKAKDGSKIPEIPEQLPSFLRDAR